MTIEIDGPATQEAQATQNVRSGTKHAREIRVLTYEPEESNGLNRRLEMMSAMRSMSMDFEETADGFGAHISLPAEEHRRQGQVEMIVEMMGSDQTVVTEQNNLIQQAKLGGYDVIVIHDRSVPSYGGRRGHGGFGFGGFSETLPVDEMPGVKALKILKHPESPLRHIPVIIMDAFEDAEDIFKQYGADDVIRSGWHMNAGSLAYGIAEVLGLEELKNPHEERERARYDETYPKPEFSEPATAIVETDHFAKQPKSNEAPIVLKGDQIAQFRNRILIEARDLSTATGIQAILRSDLLEHHKHGRVGMACEVDMTDPAEVATRLEGALQALAQIIVEQEIGSLEKLIPAVRHIAGQRGEPEEGLIYVAMAMVSGQALHDASTTPTAKGTFLDLDDISMNALCSSLRVMIAMLDFTDTLDIQNSARAMEDIGHPDACREEVKAEFAKLDEKALARETASILRTFIARARVERPNNSEEAFDLLKTIPGAEHAKSQAEFVLGSKIEKVSNMDVKGYVMLKPAEFDYVKGRLDQLAASKDHGPMTKKLAFAVSERMEQTMSIDDLELLIGTLAQFREFGGETEHPVNNVLDAVAAAIYDVRKVCVFGDHAPVTEIVHVPALEI